jgi:hypothetical protein
MAACPTLPAADPTIAPIAGTIYYGDVHAGTIAMRAGKLEAENAVL